MPAQLFGSTSNWQTLDRAIRLGAGAMGIDHSSVTLLNAAGQFETVHATHSDAAHADTLQYDLDEGPCLDAARKPSPLVMADLAEDERWPRWRPRAAALGFASILSAKLDVDRQHVGSVNLYGSAPSSFSPWRATHAQMLAGMTSLLLEGFRVEQNLLQAMQMRTQIGQAQGILMARFDVSADRAFAILRRYSQTHNVKLRDIATRLVDTRDVAKSLDRLVAPD